MNSYFQKKVFDDLGRGVLDNAWKGYNCSLFAYGQTGSGKSYSIVGTKKNKGKILLVFVFNVFFRHYSPSLRRTFQPN